MTTTPHEPVYASVAKPWLKYYDPKFFDQTPPECSAFEYVCRQNKTHLTETAITYYGRKITYADLIVNVKKTAAAFRAIGMKKRRHCHRGQRDDPGGHLCVLCCRHDRCLPESGGPAL